jgi:hypothetical protein
MAVHVDGLGRLRMKRPALDYQEGWLRPRDPRRFQGLHGISLTINDSNKPGNLLSLKSQFPQIEHMGSDTVLAHLSSLRAERTGNQTWNNGMYWIINLRHGKRGHFSSSGSRSAWVVVEVQPGIPS